MKLAAIQMVSTPSVDRNLQAAEALLAEAAAGGAALAVLPEYFCLMARSDADKLAAAEAAGDGPIQRFLAEQARRHRLWLVGGTLPLRDATTPPGLVCNSCCVYGPDGQLAARYDKMHLFRFATADEQHDEGRVIHPGRAPVAVQAGPLRVGLSVCYDLRFPELYRALMRPPCDVLVVPAAFTYPTGQAHWELLLRARAVENLAYVVAAAQGGRHENGRRTWGHTLIADPWGTVRAQRAEGEGVVLAELDATAMADLRVRLPALQHRRI